MFRFSAALLLAAAGYAAADNYAVLIAGSKDFGNYRHHADVCHAYHIMRRGGIPADNIITMMFDNVAQDFRNPFKGKLFNKPTERGDEGVDVYEGCKDNLDYTGKDVNKDTFIGVITGDEDAVKGKGNGKVLKSGKDDNVFINFVDHGGVGLIAMPQQPYLYADELQKSLQKMSDNDMYAKLVFYVEACESGSMFEGWEAPKNMYITTAANAEESSWGTYCSPDDQVNGKHVGSCLGDLYSVNWMEDTDGLDSYDQETLAKQFKTIVKTTTKSHVMKYGDDSFDSDTLDQFFGPDSSSDDDDQHAASTSLNLRGMINIGKESSPSVKAVASRDIALHSHYHTYMLADDEDETKPRLFAALQSEIAARGVADELFGITLPKIACTHYDDDSCLDKAPAMHSYEHFDCYRAAMAQLGECRSFDWGDYSLKYTGKVAALCQELSHENAVAAIAKAC